MRRPKLEPRTKNPSLVWLLGCDPGLAHFGVAMIGVRRALPLDPNSGLVMCEFAFCSVFVSKPEQKKRGVRDADDVDHRVQLLDAWLRDVLSHNHPDVVCCEAMSYPRSSSASAKSAMARAVLISLCATFGNVPFLVASPQAIRDEVVGRKVKNGVRVKTTKDQVEQAVRRLCRIDPKLRNVDQFDEVAMADREHAWDAAAAALACATSQVVRALLR